MKMYIFCKLFFMMTIQIYDNENMAMYDKKQIQLFLSPLQTLLFQKYVSEVQNNIKFYFLNFL